MKIKMGRGSKGVIGQGKTPEDLKDVFAIHVLTRYRGAVDYELIHHHDRDHPDPRNHRR
jgi:hypothetical protein